MTNRFHQPPAATPLSPDEVAGLIPTWVASQGDLNQAEGANIQRATVWASTYRTRYTNIGVAPHQIAPTVRDLPADATIWLQADQNPASSRDEIAVRFHHRLVAIHLFPNGNGRHARLTADILVGALGGSRFTLGQENLASDGDARREYLSALRRTDRTLDYGPLVAFARS